MFNKTSEIRRITNKMVCSFYQHPCIVNCTAINSVPHDPCSMWFLGPLIVEAWSLSSRLARSTEWACSRTTARAAQRTTPLPQYTESESWSVCEGPSCVMLKLHWWTGKTKILQGRRKACATNLTRSPDHDSLLNAFHSFTLALSSSNIKTSLQSEN